MIKKTKKALSIILCFALMLTNFAFADNSSDIKGHWAESQINNWIVKGYVKGFDDGTIKPDSEISRVEFIVMVNRAFGFTDTESLSFKDVKTSDWFYNDIAVAKKAGYISGFSDGTFRPNGKIYRQEAAVILARLFKLETPSNSNVLASLKDANSIPSWSEGAIASIVNQGYMKGMPDNNFLPEKSMTRAEAIVTLDRCYLDYVKVAYDKAGIYTAGVVQGSLEIKAAEVTLQDTVINGNLIINESVGDGNVKLKNVTVKGNTLVRGGGLNSIVAEDSTFKLVIIDKDDNKVRFVTSGSTIVDNVDMKSGGKLEEQNLSGSGFNTITVSQTTSSSDPVSLVGKFAALDVKASNLTINLSGDIGDLKIETTANNTTVSTSQYSNITSLSIQAALTLNGTGKVENAVVEASNVEVKVNGINITKLNVDGKADNTSINLSVESRIYNLIVDALAVITGTGKIDTAQINVSGTKVDAPTTTVNVAEGVSNVTTNVVTAPATTTSESSSSTPSTPSAPSAPSAFVSYSSEKVMGVDTTMEYSIDNWATKYDIASTSLVISGIIPAAGNPALAMKIRYKATPNAEQTLTIPARPVAPNYAVDFINERISSVASTTEYSYDNFASYVYTGNGSNVTINPNGGTGAAKHIYFRTKYTSTSFRSGVQDVTIPNRPSYTGVDSLVSVSLPSGTSGTKVSGDGTIEVSVIRSDGFIKTPWETCIVDGKDFLNAAYDDKVTFRKKATSTSFAGSTYAVVLNSSNCTYVPLATPVITGVTVAPGNYKVGDQITVTINADNSNYTAGAISINTRNVSNTFTNLANSNYTVKYTVTDGDLDRANVSDIPISVVLYNENTPNSAYTSAPTSSGTVTIDANPPYWFSIQQVTSTNNGIDADGKSRITITWTDSTSTDINHYEIIAKAGATATAADTISGMTNIVPGAQTASFDWTAGQSVSVGVVAVDEAGNKRTTTRYITTLADGATNADVATNLVINDKDQNNDASDLQVQFNAAADESTISEYRVMVVASESALTYSLTDANAIPAGRYKQVTTNGGTTYTVDYNASDVDADGNVIHTGKYYKIYILSVADGTVATINSLSVQRYDQILMPYITTSLVTGTGNESKFKIDGHGDYTDFIFKAESIDLIDSLGHPRSSFPLTGSWMYYTLNSTNTNIEVGDQITVTDDGTGVVTISLTNNDSDNSLDGTYTINVAPAFMGPEASVTFTISGTSITVTGVN